MNRSSKKLIPAGLPHERRHPLANGGVKITTFVPVRFKKRGVRKVLVAPDGVDEAVAWCATTAIAPSHDSVLLRALGRAYYWQHLLDTGAVADTAAIAEREGMIRSTVSQVLRLALLAPDIAETALAGRLPRTLSLERLLWATLPREWSEQREMIAGIGLPEGSGTALPKRA